MHCRLSYPPQQYQAVMPNVQQFEGPKELAQWLRSPRMTRRIAGLAAGAQLEIPPALATAAASAAAAPAAAPAAAASSGSSGPAGQRGRGHSSEALTERQPGPDLRLQRQHLRWEEEEEEEEQQEQEMLRPPAYHQQQQQQPTSPKEGKRHAEDGQGGSLASKRPRVQQDEDVTSEHERPVQQTQQKVQHKSKVRQHDEDEQPARAAQLGGSAELEPVSPGKKKRKKERQQQQSGEVEQAQEQEQEQQPPQQQQVAAGAERGRGPQPSGAAAAAAAAAGAEQQQGAALQPASAQQPEAAQRAAAAAAELPVLPELPCSVPVGVSSAWWALNQLRPHLEQRGVCDATEVRTGLARQAGCQCSLQQANDGRCRAWAR